VEYLALFLFFIVVELIYFYIADRYNIIDKPNKRSSHSAITLRGGGILFPIAISVAYCLGYVSWEVTVAVVLVGAVSFIDDIKPLSQLPRIAAHVIAGGVVFYYLNLFSEAIWLLPLLFIVMIGWINTFNFMDGINGMTVLYSVIAIVSFAFLPMHETSLPLLITMGLSCVVFGIYNVRKKAKTFAGDVGSISMAVFLGYFMIKTILDAGQVGYILFFSVYGVDTVVTISNRLVRKENIFEAHRSHLYQFLTNEMGYSHVLVAVIYAAFQLGINIIVIQRAMNESLSLYFSGGFLLFIASFYLGTRVFIIRKVRLRKSMI
jgi:UDP-N-acetylmuramyl pentapeptide phosphotransferase/UDP-N-acetylglucosamine-1-phosphate transferase